MKLHHVAVVCRSIEKADRFYKDLLGLKKIKEAVLDEAFMHQLFGTPVSSALVKYGNDHLALEVFLPAAEPSLPPQLAHCCLAVEGREAFIGRCQAAGVTVKQVPKGDSMVVFIKDFDGNQFEIKEAS